MARGRFISASISESEEFADLPTNDTRLFFLMLIPQLDVEGRLKADLRYLKGKVFTYIAFNYSDILTELIRLDSAGLIKLYAAKGKAYLYLPKFADHQAGLRKDREAPSKIPEPTAENTVQDAITILTELLPQNCGVTPAQDKFKVKYKFKGEDEDKGGEAQDLKEQEKKPRYISAEERAHLQMTQGIGVVDDKHRVRNQLKKLWPDFAKKNEVNLEAWVKHSDDRIAELYEASHPKHWQGTDKEATNRLFIFLNLLNEEYLPLNEIPPKVDTLSYSDQLRAELKEEGILN